MSLINSSLSRWCNILKNSSSLVHVKPLNLSQDTDCFCHAGAMLCAHEISRMTDQTKRWFKNEINILLQGNILAKRQGTGAVKVLRAMKLGIPEAESKSKYWVPRKVWMVLTKDAQDDMCPCNSVNIGLVKEYLVQYVKPSARGGGHS